MIMFVSSDIHSFFDEWMKALEEAGFDKDNPEHGVLVCGDLMDRGSKPLECLKFINDLHRQGRAIMIKGNHEELLEEIFSKRYFERHDVSNGTLRTCELISGIEDDGKLYDYFSHDISVIDKTCNDEEVKYYLDNVVDYYESGKYVFVHGWIPVKQEIDKWGWPTGDLTKTKDWRNGDWSEARWLNGMNMWSKGIKLRGKTIVCGHWHSSYGNFRFHKEGHESLSDALYAMDDSEISLYYNSSIITPEAQALYNKYVDSTPFVDKGIIALDACTVLSGRVNVFIFEDDKDGSK